MTVFLTQPTLQAMIFLTIYTSSIDNRVLFGMVSSLYLHLFDIPLNKERPLMYCFLCFLRRHLHLDYCLKRRNLISLGKGL